MSTKSSLAGRPSKQVCKPSLSLSVWPVGLDDDGKDPVAVPLPRTPGNPLRDGLKAAGFVTIHGEIGADGQTPRDLAHALADLEGPIHIRSGGGDFLAGLGMAEQVRQSGRTVIADVASSAAAPILAAGKRRILASNGWMLVHAGWCFAGGRADRLREHADALARMDRAYESALAKYSGQPIETVQEWTAAETIFTPEQALSAGLIDEIGPPAELKPRPEQVPNLEADLIHQAARAFDIRPHTTEHTRATSAALAQYRDEALDELIRCGHPSDWPVNERTDAASFEVGVWTNRALIRHHDQGRPLPTGLAPARWRCADCSELNYHAPVQPDQTPAVCPYCNV